MKRMRVQEQGWEEQFRSRWRKWLGAMTRFDRPIWSQLLSADYLSWPESVLQDDWVVIGWQAPREIVKEVYAKAIERATLDDLCRLDGIFCTAQFERKYK
jgi:hypothetical protein